jgi:hypothetical protein
MGKPSLRSLLLMIFIGLVSLAGLAFAQEGPYTIRSVEFRKTGASLVAVLRDKADIDIGAGFDDTAALDAYLADRRQVLLNQRVLESVELSYSASPAAAGGVDVDVVVTTTDSWNIVGLPYFRFDQNVGLLLSLRGRDYNFLGSMQTLVLNLDYTKDMNGLDGFGGLASFDVPVWLLGQTWSLAASDDLKVYADGRPTRNLAASSFGLTFKRQDFDVTIKGIQSFTTNPDGLRFDQDPYYLTSALSVSASVPTGITFGRFGSLNYTPSGRLSKNWRIEAPVRADRQGSIFTFSHGLSFGRVDWQGNLRSGMSLSMTNTETYDFESFGSSAVVAWDIAAYASTAERFGLATRFTGVYDFWGSLGTELGSNMRGIINARLSGDFGAFANLDFPIKLFDFPTHVFIGRRWFDFELQASPFFDAGFVAIRGQQIGPENYWYSGGLEFLVYPALMRSFIVRASLGFDLDAAIANESFTAPSKRDGALPFEIYFGVGLFY